ncbi:hypothetical protein E2C01_032381 [Portunus trituberculatus]|uniref:Uncharacterized protein n=1 Tax=Portunus trituberculatus TaxID=210409 RepID=A0A5B7EZH6_PORTR|nr:hypothetical protein [Portunus trituberculatus]
MTNIHCEECLVWCIYSLLGYFLQLFFGTVYCPFHLLIFIYLFFFFLFLDACGCTFTIFLMALVEVTRVFKDVSVILVTY